MRSLVVITEGGGGGRGGERRGERSWVDVQNIPLLLLSFITATLSTTARREALDWGTG